MMEGSTTSLKGRLESGRADKGRAGYKYRPGLRLFSTTFVRFTSVPHWGNYNGIFQVESILHHPSCQLMLYPLSLNFVFTCP